MKKYLTKLLCSLLAMTFVFTFVITAGCVNTANAATEKKSSKTVTFSCGLQLKLRAVFDKSGDSYEVNDYDYVELEKTSSISDYLVQTNSTNNSVTFDISVTTNNDHYYTKTYTVTCDSNGTVRWR